MLLNYLTSILASRVIQTFVVISALSASLVQLESSRTHALETAKSVDTLSW